MNEQMNERTYVRTNERTNKQISQTTYVEQRKRLTAAPVMKPPIKYGKPLPYFSATFSLL